MSEGATEGTFSDGATVTEGTFSGATETDGTFSGATETEATFSERADTDGTAGGAFSGSLSKGSDGAKAVLGMREG